jgi:RNA polymerase sigma-70 factor, ECF subfamily
VPNFESLFHQYFYDIYRYVYFKTKQNWDTDDIVSETFRKAFVKLSTIHKEQNLKAWLFTIARHSIIDYYRSKHYKQMHFLDEYQGDSAWSQESARPFDGKEAYEDLYQALQQLQAEEQLIIRMKYIEGFKYSEIGSLIGIPAVTAKMKSHRALKKMKKMLLLQAQEA